MLNSHSDVSLRSLCFRLDFNEYYKNHEPKHSYNTPSKFNYTKYKKGAGSTSSSSGVENTKL